MIKKRVLVADDSAFMRKLLTDIINADDELEVVAQARDGEDVLRKLDEYKPDVLTLDVEMPVMDGLTTLKNIMTNKPLPVIMLSAHTQNGANATLKALEIGAVDFVTKPGGSISPGIAKMSEEIVGKIKTALKVKIKNVKSNNDENKIISTIEYKKHDLFSSERPSSLLLIGTSTGGPKALNEVMSKFKDHYNSAALIVQHMPPGFTKSLAQRLDINSVYQVKEAENGEEVKAGMAYIAPGDHHMEIINSAGKIIVSLNQNVLVNGHRPSVDVLMKSAAKIPIHKVGVIMTGMGNDGAAGMKALKEAGAVNIGESSETCVVYSMPRSAKQLGAIDHELPLYKISEFVERALTNR